MPTKYLPSCLAIVIASALSPASAASAADLNIDYSTRISLGITPGINVPAHEVDDLTAQLAKINPGMSAEYKSKTAMNAELPLIVNIRGDGPFYVVVAPALVYSKNKAELSANTNASNPLQIQVSREDSFTQLGGKLYVGAGFGGRTGFHGELLPYIGMSSVKVESDAVLDGLNTGTGVRAHFEDSETAHGALTLYGITLGGYFTPESATNLEFGGRVGYAGALGQIDGTDIVQSGLLAALEVGWHF